MKLSLEDKLEIVRLYEEQGLSHREIAKKYNVRYSNINTIIYRYKYHGVSTLKHPASNRKYSADFKLMIIEQVYKGRSKTSLAAEYNLPGVGTIVLWMHKYEKLGYNGLISKRKGRPKKNMDPKKEEKIKVDNSSPLTNFERKEFEELKKELEYVKMENEFLKKLDALVQERLKRERKK